MKSRLPDWFRIQLPKGENLVRYNTVRNIQQNLKLNTVCKEATCPNIAECWGRGTATFMLMGDICTRACRYCDVRTGKPVYLDVKEPENVAKAVKELGLKYIVLTSVTRDDLPLGGAQHFADTVSAVKRLSPGTKVEVLIPDFWAEAKALQLLIKSKPYVIAHNIETVRRIYPKVRPKGGYELALDVFRKLRMLLESNPLLTKSSVMVGLGESTDEIIQTMNDLHEAGCHLLAIGQYLSPSKKHAKVARFYTPDEFSELKEKALKVGFLQCISGPLVRSSYMAENAVNGL